MGGKKCIPTAVESTLPPANRETDCTHTCRKYILLLISCSRYANKQQQRTRSVEREGEATAKMECCPPSLLLDNTGNVQFTIFTNLFTFFGITAISKVTKRSILVLKLLQSS